MEVDVSGSLATGSGAQEADGRPAWSAEALLQLCGRGQRVWAALHGPCNMLVWWSLRHGGVTGSGHDRHRADDIGALGRNRRAPIQTVTEGVRVVDAIMVRYSSASGP